MPTVNFNIRIDKELKDNANQVFENYGMTMAQAFKMFLVNVSHTKKVPLTFDYQAVEPVLTAKAQERLRQTQQEFADGEFESFKNLDELNQAMAEINRG
ncbi:MAG: type II toxin-antitoxin system RelB/DinJ family antitoxin [Neisseria sp.]|nr:type II toxin-antitoxin system RelB/DinJ family antitoxin [Neisseria sp.]